MADDWANKFFAFVTKPHQSLCTDFSLIEIEKYLQNPNHKSKTMYVK